jgi:hypothetical protein
MGLDGFFTKIVRSLEQSLGRPLNLELQAAVAQDLEKHLLAFDTCGSSSLCDEATIPAKWNKGFDPILLSSNPVDMDKVGRFHLNLPQDSLEVFTGALARFVESHLSGSDASRREEAAQALNDVISPYLFYGEICRKTDLCASAEPRPVKINVKVAP